MVISIRRLGWAKRMAEQIQKYDLSHQQMLAAIFGQTRLDRCSCTTNERRLTSCAIPREKQFRDDINSLKDFGKGDEFARRFEKRFFTCLPMIFAHLIYT